MSKLIRKCGKDQGNVLSSNTLKRIEPSKLRKLDVTEKEGYIKGVVKDIIQDPGRGAKASI